MCILLQGAKALEDFIDRIRTDSTSSLPPDGTVHQLTSDVLVFVQQLLEYTETIAAVLVQDVSYVNAINLEQHKPTDKNKILLGIYISKYELYMQSAVRFTQWQGALSLIKVTLGSHCTFFFSVPFFSP
jgi:Exo70 exocyst complex subunit.